MNLYFSNIKMDGMIRLKGELDYRNKMTEADKIEALKQRYQSVLYALETNIKRAINMLEIVYEDSLFIE